MALLFEAAAEVREQEAQMAQLRDVGGELHCLCWVVLCGWGSSFGTVPTPHTCTD